MSVVKDRAVRERRLRKGYHLRREEGVGVGGLRRGEVPGRTAWEFWVGGVTGALEPDGQFSFLIPTLPGCVILGWLLSLPGP